MPLHLVCAIGILIRMHATSVRVASTTRDAVRELADEDGVTMDEAIRRLVRAERQRRMGVALAAAPTGDDLAWIDAGVAVVADDASR